ncbi:type II toxin-antitoxin system death-on-curing family toxin [Diaminobutyricibacter sp. McL0618]|uniref:type II toxin-antitoxin system death-on-curing family toxin n=1 Tax=Leifsonia sp. McL0618 TaxID=3415677 RepID=UPI003CEE9169
MTEPDDIDIEYLDPVDVEELITSAGFSVRDRNLLLSALASPLPVFGEEVYPGLYNKAGILMLAINRDHPLADGNKRLSWVVTKGFLALNGHDLAADSVQEGNAFVRAVASRQLDRVEIVAWIEGHAIRLV